MHVRVTEKNPSARASSDRGGCWQHVGDEKTLRSRFEGRRGMVADEGHAGDEKTPTAHVSSDRGDWWQRVNL